ncbi:prepilin-type N-terminal cleavage/methylation domain-containing protein [Clostridium thermobutyricum]|uniref:Prepilin-type N-terminal cleavage/methylation domain-containing protein n=1 Tax=Clostridium thermobutyricum TaxID=29372 RepID=N9XLS7_9CLOT|nr:type II secretion system protein [Clostridium thermobutyricum]ENZ00638.1 prepilin-type N-terminal cleavage/methylation domain-containing protein [Clostridium thermobutyricum]
MKDIAKNKKKKGFTLIEMVAVVAIIGILAAILVPKITGYMKEAKKTAVIDQARKVTQAYETAEMKGKTVDSSGKVVIETSTAVNAISDPTMLSLLDDSNTPIATTLKNLCKTGKIATIADCFDIVAGGEFTVDSDGYYQGDVVDTVSK